MEKSVKQTPALNQIPVIHLDDWKEGDDELLVASLAEFGLAHISGHGISPTLMAQFYQGFEDVLGRPDKEKAELGGSSVWYQRGWTPPDTEKAVVAGGQPDFKECYFVAPIPLDQGCQIEYPQIYARNIWPENAESFKENYLRLGLRLHEVGLSLLSSIASGLGLPRDLITNLVEGGAHVTRALKYLALSSDQIERGVLWGEEHTDFNVLTILPGGQFFDSSGSNIANPDPESGLYLRTRSGRKVRGSAPKGSIVIQVGQPLEILTGGRLLATPHVVTAPRVPNITRYSCAHFVHLHAHQVVRPLPLFESAESIRSYAPPVLAGTYARKTLVDIGLAPKSAMESLGYRHYDRLVAQRSSDEPT